MLEIMLAVALFGMGAVALGRAGGECVGVLGALGEEELAYRALVNAAAEINANSALPQERREIPLPKGYEGRKLAQRVEPFKARSEDNTELEGLYKVTLTLNWRRGGVEEKRDVVFLIRR